MDVVAAAAVGNDGLAAASSGAFGDGPEGSHGWSGVLRGRPPFLPFRFGFLVVHVLWFDKPGIAFFGSLDLTGYAQSANMGFG